MPRVAPPAAPRPRVGGSAKKSSQTESIDDHFEALSLTQLECRGDWHSWPRGVRFAPVEWHGKTDLVAKVQRVLICLGGCGTIRTDVIRYERNGSERMSSSYKYDVNYTRKTPPGGKQISKSEYRHRLRVSQQPELHYPNPRKGQAA